jgi:cytochrome oxidase Cu insertion factor (SCO1/SenC/PrrC family)
MTARAVAARIDEVRRRPDAARELAAMLAEQSASFAGRGTNEAERLRGYVLAGFETAGLPPEAVPFVLEELELGRNPYTVAAAARALRGAEDVPAETPALIVGAIARLRSSDDVVSFDGFAPTPTRGDSVTALAELARTLAWLGPRAKPALDDLRALVEGDGEKFSPAVGAELARAAEALAREDSAAAAPCCSEHGGPAPADAAPVGGTELADLTLEDQDGTRLSFSEAFAGRPTALTFFYTRCQVPEKCSLTVTRLGRLARACEAEALEANVAGITYDPAFDRPARLKTFGADRGVVFTPRCRLLRTTGPFGPVREAFDLGVGFGPVTVNRHRIDLLVLDASLGVAARFERRLWHEAAVLSALRAAPTPQARPATRSRSPQAAAQRFGRRAARAG